MISDTITYHMATKKSWPAEQLDVCEEPGTKTCLLESQKWIRQSKKVPVGTYSHGVHHGRRELIEHGNHRPFCHSTPRPHKDKQI